MKSKDWLILAGIVVGALVLLPSREQALPGVPGMQVYGGGEDTGYGDFLTGLLTGRAFTPTPRLDADGYAITNGQAPAVQPRAPTPLQPIFNIFSGGDLSNISPVLRSVVSEVSRAVIAAKQTAVGTPAAIMAKVELQKPRQLFKIGPFRIGPYTLAEKGATVTPTARAYGILAEHGMLAMTHEQRLAYLQARYPAGS